MLLTMMSHWLLLLPKTEVDCPKRLLLQLTMMMLWKWRVQASKLESHEQMSVMTTLMMRKRLWRMEATKRTTWWKELNNEKEREHKQPKVMMDKQKRPIRRMKELE